MQEKDTPPTNVVLNTPTSTKVLDLTNDYKLFFRDDARLLFAFRKSQKLTSALYLVTNLIPEGEGLRQSLRELGLFLVKDILESASFKKTTPVPYILEIVSLLEIAASAELISPMNMEVLRRGYQDVLAIFTEGERRLPSMALREDFLSVDVPEGFPPKARFLSDEARSDFPADSPAGDSGDSRERIPQAPQASGKRPPGRDFHIGQHKGQSNGQKEHRSEAILEVIRNSVEPASIKDITLHIRGVGEKTIQRELGSLVARGVLKKEGERRWSRYSLRK